MQCYKEKMEELSMTEDPYLVYERCHELAELGADSMSRPLQLHMHLIKTLSPYMRGSLKGYKSLDGYNFYIPAKQLR